MDGYKKNASYIPQMFESWYDCQKKSLNTERNLLYVGIIRAIHLFYIKGSSTPCELIRI